MKSSRFHLAKRIMPRNRSTAPAVPPYVAHRNASCTISRTVSEDAAEYTALEWNKTSQGQVNGKLT